ncbi:hypothetical protein [Autumnicola edwardsiae]|uniref:Uncharacterized protein n=1 Tax=Autumnicola edwardsiae TaxID=3075594 RepID=A0ABU3CV21_9FLAO|nr:hypothetical protein [Zunongwangia sp. F297]MDT0650211.1 hypothetical protein [Zunongwangia sp. F297]
MKIILSALIILISFQISGQELNKRQLSKISKFGIDTSNFNNDEHQINEDFRNILKAERRRKSNKVVGIVLTSLAAISIGLGVATFATPVESEGHESAFRGIIGSFLVGTGAIEGGIGIPLLFVSRRKKRQRNLLIEKYKDPPNKLVINNNLYK